LSSFDSTLRLKDVILNLASSRVKDLAPNEKLKKHFSDAEIVDCICWSA